MKNIPPTNSLDKPIWMLEQSGNFYVKNSWKYIRWEDEKFNIFEFIWSKRLPYFYFFLWKAWKFIVPADDVFQHMRINIASRCMCWIQPNLETMSHLFLTSYTTAKLWRLMLILQVSQISQRGVVKQTKQR